MAFNELEYHAVKKAVDLFVERICPPHNARFKRDIVYRIENLTISIAEVWSVCEDYPAEKQELAVAKISYVRAQKVWKLYWIRETLTWELFDFTSSLEEALNLIGAHARDCFFKQP